MIQGFNHNMKYRNIVFHIQTEDLGTKIAKIITHLFVGGNIIATQRKSYKEILNSPIRDTLLKEDMKNQHKKVIKALITSEYDKRIDSFISKKENKKKEKEKEKEKNITKVETKKKEIKIKKNTFIEEEEKEFALLKTDGITKLLEFDPVKSYKNIQKTTNETFRDLNEIHDKLDNLSSKTLELSKKADRFLDQLLDDNNFQKINSLEEFTSNDIEELSSIFDVKVKRDVFDDSETNFLDFTIDNKSSILVDSSDEVESINLDDFDDNDVKEITGIFNIKPANTSDFLDREDIEEISDFLNFDTEDLDERKKMISNANNELNLDSYSYDVSTKDYTDDNFGFTEKDKKNNLDEFNKKMIEKSENELLKNSLKKFTGDDLIAKEEFQSGGIDYLTDEYTGFDQFNNDDIIEEDSITISADQLIKRSHTKKILKGNNNKNQEEEQLLKEVMKISKKEIIEHTKTYIDDENDEFTSFEMFSDDSGEEITYSHFKKQSVTSKIEIIDEKTLEDEKYILKKKKEKKDSNIDMMIIDFLENS